MKHLYLLRHAIAVDRGPIGIRDSERPLTEEGRKKMIQATHGLAHWGLKVEVCLSSPYIRAWETAAIVQEHLPFPTKIEQEDSLIPGGSLTEFLSLLNKRPETHFLAVGHEPTMSSWIEDLLGCGRPVSIVMKKGGLCHLTLDLSQDPPWVELKELLPPRVLRGLG